MDVLKAALLSCLGEGTGKPGRKRQAQVPSRVFFLVSCGVAAGVRGVAAATAPAQQPRSGRVRTGGGGGGVWRRCDSDRSHSVGVRRACCMTGAASGQLPCADDVARLGGARRHPSGILTSSVICPQRVCYVVSAAASR